MKLKKLVSIVVAGLISASVLPLSAIAANEVAQIGTIGYETVALAVAAADEGDKITLVSNVNEDVVIPVGKTITLNLGGFKLTNVKGHTITNNGKLTIEGEGTVDNTTHLKGALVSQGNSETTINGGTYTRSLEAGIPTSNGKNSWYVMQVKNTAVLTINEGTTVTNTSKFSSLIDNYSEIIINGGTFTNGFNVLKTEEKTKTEINGGTFTAKDWGFALMNYGDATINGGTYKSESTGEYAEAGASGAIVATSWETDPSNTSILYAEINGDILIKPAKTKDGVDHDGKVSVEILGGEVNGNINCPSINPSISVTGGEINGALNIKDENNTTTISGGAFTADPTKYLVADSDAITVTADGEKNYYIGESVEKALEDIKAGSEIDVVAGNLTISVEVDDVKVTNSGSGLVTVVEDGKTTVLVDGKTLAHVSATEPTCANEGNTEYWFDADNNKYYSDEELKNEITLADTVIKALSHEAVKVEAKAATETEDGNIEYWHCADCGKYFSDEALTEEITLDDTVVKATGETPDSGKLHEDSKKPTTDDASNTGMAAPILVTLILGAVAIVMFSRKKSVK